MGLIRLLILMFLLYLASKMFGKIFQPRLRQTEIRGQSQSPPLDLSKKDVEDVDYKESPR